MKRRLMLNWITNKFHQLTKKECKNLKEEEEVEEEEEEMEVEN
jgi:hypothetical protein